jgi:hypothetical protein
MARKTSCFSSDAHLVEFVPSGRFGHHQEPSLSAKIVALFCLLRSDDNCDQHGDGSHARQRERDGAFQLVRSGSEFASKPPGARFAEKTRGPRYSDRQRRDNTPVQRADRAEF